MAGLANLALSDEEVVRLAKDLDEILSHVEKLNELDTTGVEPMAQVLFEGEADYAFRADVEHTPLPNELATANAPLKGAGYFKVPKVIER